MEELECIWNGHLFQDDTHLQEIRQTFLESLLGADGGYSCQKSVQKCSELERIKLLNGHFQWIPIPEEYFARMQI